MSTGTSTRLVRHGIAVAIVATVVIALLVNDTIADGLGYIRSNVKAPKKPSFAEMVAENGKFGRQNQIPSNIILRRQKRFGVGIDEQSKQMYTSSDLDKNSNLPELALTEEHLGLSGEELTKKKNEFLKKLSQDNREEIENRTRDQNQNQEWFEARRVRLTASEFGNVCKMRWDTSCKLRVHRLLYSTKNVSHNDALMHGHVMESVARKCFQSLIASSVRECGLFIDKEYPYLAGSPDGLVGSHSILEIKCPYLARDTGSILEAIQKKMVNYCSVVGKKVILKRNHLYYYQIMGQLRVTGRLVCYFVIYTKNWIHVEQIMYDDTFWKTKMVDKLKSFYLECLLPEIVDPLFTKRMLIADIREPLHILEAQKEEKKKIEEMYNVVKK